MKASYFCVVADFDLRVGQFPQLLNCFYIGGAHVGGGDDPELAAVLGKLPKLIHQKPQATPFDEGHQHIDAVSGSNFFLKLNVQLRLLGGPGEQRALRNRTFRADHVCGGFAHSHFRIRFPQKSKKLLCTLGNAQRGKVSFLGCTLNEVDDLINQCNLG